MSNQAVSQTPQELNLAAKALIQQGKFDEARGLLESSLAQEKTPAALRYHGVICRLSKDLQTALQWFEEALKLDPQDHATLSQVAETHFDAGNLTEATALYAFAIKYDPTNLHYMERFVGMSQRVTFANYSEVVEEAVVACLRCPDLNAYQLQALWYNTFLLNPALQKVYNPGGWKAKLFGGAEIDVAPLNTAFFLEGLRHLTVCSMDFENFLQRLRRTLLDRQGKDIELAAALSHYCYNNEYIFVISGEEKDAVQKLRTRIEGGEILAPLVALYGCYDRLYTLGNAKSVADKLKNDPVLADVVKLQLLEHFALQELRHTIPAATEIENEVSQKVREQYEESPYPMWVKLPRGLYAEKPAEHLKGKPAKILVAGCGTGHESLQYSVIFPEAEVTAIDLSLTSMAYAKRKAAELGIKNTEFRQADILKVAQMNQKFDVVVSGGVLHHMQDTFKGWQVLTTVMKDDAVMKIGLYSRTARRNLLEAHAIIKKNHPNLDLDGMREFRGNSEKYLGKKLLSTLSRFEDYYHLSMYRDMMFHVQERNMTLEEIEEMLDKLGLEFIGFSLPREIKAAFVATYPNDPEGANIKNWQEFERNNPDTFSACYIFWCRKKQGKIK